MGNWRSKTLLQNESLPTCCRLTQCEGCWQQNGKGALMFRKEPHGCYMLIVYKRKRKCIQVYTSEKEGNLGQDQLYSWRAARQRGICSYKMKLALVR